MRKTGWSLSAVSVGFLRNFASSKKLLLSEVIRIDNLANNGGILLKFWFVDNYLLLWSVTSSTVKLEDQIVNKTIPWEVDLKLISLILLVFLMEMAV